MTVEQMKKKSRNAIRKLVKVTALKNKGVILLLDGMRVHFRQKDAWPLSYQAYRELSKLNGTYFDQLLFIKKYKVLYKDGSLLIVKDKR